MRISNFVQLPLHKDATIKMRPWQRKAPSFMHRIVYVLCNYLQYWLLHGLTVQGVEYDIPCVYPWGIAKTWICSIFFLNPDSDCQKQLLYLCILASCSLLRLRKEVVQNHITEPAIDVTPLCPGAFVWESSLKIKKLKLFCPFRQGFLADRHPESDWWWRTEDMSHAHNIIHAMLY